MEKTGENNNKNTEKISLLAMCLMLIEVTNPWFFVQPFNFGIKEINVRGGSMELQP